MNDLWDIWSWIGVVALLVGAAMGGAAVWVLLNGHHLGLGLVLCVSSWVLLKVGDELTR